MTIRELFKQKSRGFYLFFTASDYYSIWFWFWKLLMLWIRLFQDPQNRLLLSVQDSLHISLAILKIWFFQQNYQHYQQYGPSSRIFVIIGQGLFY